ncbi:tyrosine-type recombinase/integrase [Sorangium sp. So ce1000]|uniref:tyrosine-type recombinase/integrase n=1 Tax=Sorangium sp. So ce1000 TaxID=3133325 RepID=UPI003F5EC7AA
MTDVPQRRARAKRSPALPSSSVPASTPTDPRARASRSGGRPSPAADVAAPDASPPGSVSSTEHPKPTVRSAGRSAGEKRANGSGSVRLRGKTWTARLSLGEAGRPTFSLPTCRTEQEANARLEVLSELAGGLLAAGQIVLGLPLLEQAAAREGSALRDVRLAINHLCRGEARARASGETTFAEFAERVLSGKLAEQYPDHVKAIRTADKYEQRLGHVLDVLGPVPLVRFTLDHADHAMSRLPAHLEPGSRRNIAIVIHRLLALAAYPARIIAHNPLPRGWIPKIENNKAKGYLYPDEDQRLMRSQMVPLCFRVYYGFLTREGMRADEAGTLEWSDVDLDRGAVVLDENKTDDPRAWALSPDVVRALRAYRELWPDNRSVFVGPKGDPLPGCHGAERFRDHLQSAGVDRPELFETTESRLNIRLHDTRATFITIKLANGRTETWISDRTGHKSSGQIHHYKRAARKIAELGLGDFAPLDEAIPELRGKGGSVGGGQPASAGADTGSASAEASASGAPPGQTAPPADVPAPATADVGAFTGGSLGPRWATPEDDSAKRQSEPIEIIDISTADVSAPERSSRNISTRALCSSVGMTLMPRAHPMPARNDGRTPRRAPPQGWRRHGGGLRTPRREAPSTALMDPSRTSNGLPGARRYNSLHRSAARRAPPKRRIP